MINRKNLYGYHIENGELAIVPQEAETVQRITTLYIAGGSYQSIAETLNDDGTPFSTEAPLWNKHKVKRLLENPCYTGQKGYPAIIDTETFHTVQRVIREKTAGHAPPKDRPALRLKPYLRCACCEGDLHRLAGKNRRADTLYLKCIRCGALVTISDTELMNEVFCQMAEHDHPTEQPYAPSGEVIRLTNAINRGLEHPDKPEDIVALILQGASARYDCCPAPTESEPFSRPAEVDLKRFGQAVSHITIADGTITVHFK
ncbi:recombinase family protein [Oscillospiraceae bacterium 21-37]|jgi:hypothetical protein|nr:recombinase family protein [uncultured Oscillibacter sp.]